ncbi:MAG: DUF4382 domain-containing protein [Bacteroidota bacterium]
MRTKLISVIFLLLGVMYGCSELFNGDEFDNLNKEKSTVIIKLTDAPFPSDLVAEANVAIDWIKLKRVVVDSTEQDSVSPFLMLEVKDTFNLLDLSNGVTEVLGQLDSVPAGEYSEIRMHVVDASVVLNDGQVFDLKIPSGSSSGLKIKLKPALVVEGGEYEILLDFDVSRSFKVLGNINNNGKGKDKGIKGFMFKPVIRAVSLTSETGQSTTGEVFGTVVDTSDVKIENANLYLTSGQDTIATAKTSEEGLYRIIGVPGGDYSLSCEKEGYESGQADVTVTVGDETEQNFTLTKLAED